MTFKSLKDLLLHSPLAPAIYVDDVYCDVVHMKACHLLLGRPWQYDRCVINDQLEHTHAFCKDGKKIVLPAMKPEEINTKKKSTDSEPSKALLASSNNFEAGENDAGASSLSREKQQRITLEQIKDAANDMQEYPLNGKTYPKEPAQDREDKPVPCKITNFLEASEILETI